MKLADFKSALPVVVKTQKIISGLETSKQTLAQLFNSANKIKAPASNGFEEVDKAVLQEARTSHRSLLQMLQSSVIRRNMISNVDVLIKLCSMMPESIPSRDASVKAASIIATSELVDVMTNYTSMYLIELVKSEAAVSSSKAIYEAHKPTRRKLRNDASSYALAITYLTKRPDALQAELSSLPDLNVTKYNESNVRATGAFGKRTPIDFLTSGFIHNPIYHARLYFTEFQIWRYKILRDEAQQLELLLMALHAERSDQPSPGVEREIEMTEERIATARRKMANISEGDNANF